jgi:hypothetical protein
MFAFMILGFSVVALSQFALNYYRAILVGAAAQSISADVLAAACVENREVSGRDFATFTQLHQLTPKLEAGRGGLGMVQTYYKAVEAIGSVASNRMPALAAWSERELTNCARYVAVMIDRRLQANMEMAAAVRSI